MAIPVALIDALEAAAAAWKAEGEQPEWDAQMRACYALDAEDLMDAVRWLREGHPDRAAHTLSLVDTIVREEVPPALWGMLFKDD